MSNSPMWNPLDSGGFIFDWDGVLADTRLDFSSIREKYFGGRDAAILEEMSHMDSEEREKLSNDIKRVEMEGASIATAIPGGTELVSFLNERHIPWSVVSRNCPESIYLSAKTIGFNLPENTFHRESGHIKPSPEALWMAAGVMGIPANSCTMIGDYVYDLLGARRAGMRAILVERGQESWSHWADGHFPKLENFLTSLREGLELVPWEYHGLVDKKGIDWLISAWNLSIEIPTPFEKDDLELVFKLASMGVGNFVASEDTQAVDMWWALPWFSVEDLDRPQWSILKRLLSSRYQRVSVSKKGEGIPLASFREDPEARLEEILG